MNKLIYMVGLPGSGKSVLSEKLKVKYNAEIVSTDAIREELFGDIETFNQTSKVFNEALLRVRNFLKKGVNVIFDATNLSSKRRMGFLKQIKDIETICYYISCPHKDKLEENSIKRGRAVPMDVISKFYESAQIPMYHEGWDEINIIYPDYLELPVLNHKREELENLIFSEKLSHDLLFDSLSEISKDFNNIYNLAQDSSYHSFSVSRHTFYVLDEVIKNCAEKERLEMAWASLLHDIGKFETKKFREEKRYASFIGHENVSAQKAVEILYTLGYDKDFILNVSSLVQLHMRINQGDTKLKNNIDKELYRKLCLISDADKLAK